MPFLYQAVHGSVGRDAVMSPARLSKAHIYVGLSIWYTGGSCMSSISTQKLDFRGEEWEVGTTCSSGEKKKDNGSLILLPQQSLGMYLLIIFPFSLSLLGLELEGQMHRLGRLPAPCSTK